MNKIVLRDVLKNKWPWGGKIEILQHLQISILIKINLKTKNWN